MSLHESTVFVIDDDPGMRKSICFLIDSLGIRIEAYDCAEAFLAAYQPARIGCLVLDMCMPGITGLQLLEELATRGDYRPAIMLTGHGDIPTAVRAMRAGALDFLEKPFDDREFLARVRQCIDLDVQWRKWQAQAVEILDRLAALSPREREVMDLVVAGNSTKQIAALLTLSPKTVEIHRTHVMRKMQVHSSVELVRMAMVCRKTKGSALQASAA